MTPHGLEHHNDTVRALVRALDLHIPGEGAHAERVAVFAVATGERLGLSYEELLTLRRAAALHDLGKLAIERGVCAKPGPLTEGEAMGMRAHSVSALAIVGAFGWLRDAAPLIRHHHELWDGTGYPDGLSETAIPIGARIISVAESFDVLIFGAPWKSPLPEPKALREIEAKAGSQFDPAVVDAFLEIQPLIQPVLF
jgi:response regulator RpfG family c-di-GMP phosphodiesterase